MPKFSSKNVKLEPIELEIDGKNYVIEKITAKDLEAMSAVDEDSNDPLEICRPLAAILKIDPKSLVDLDMRIIGAATKFVGDTIKDSFRDEEAKK